MGMVIGATAAAAPVGGDGHRYPRPKRARGHHNTPQSEAVVHRSLETAAAFVCHRGLQPAPTQRDRGPVLAFIRCGLGATSIPARFRHPQTHIGPPS